MIKNSSNLLQLQQAVPHSSSNAYQMNQRMPNDQTQAQRKRNNSTEAARLIFGTQNAPIHNQQATYESQNRYKGQQPPESSNTYQNMSAMITSELQKRAEAPVGQSVNEYQSILLTRYLKEPRLPPSSTYYNNNSRKKKPSVSRGSRPFPQSTSGTGPYTKASGNDDKPATSPHKQVKQPLVSRKMPQVFGRGGGIDISYRNQNEIMRKIFGNEQGYHQVKSLLNRAPYSQEETQKLIRSPKNGAQQKPSSSPINIKMKTASGAFDRKSTGKYYDQSHQGVPSPTIGSDEIILAKSHQKDQQFPTVQPNLKTDRPHTHSAVQIPAHPQGHTDQVEKAIFDLQDVKNNYFQEKTLFDQKIQQIQNKQNMTMSSGFGVMSYNRTATAGFLPTTAGSSQRPITQGGAAGMFMKNQPLMADNNILKGDLESVTKEDLRERLIVAEMVMKKLFQRNKYLEDMAHDSVKEQTIERDQSDDEDSVQRKFPKSNMISPNNSNLESVDVTDIQGNAPRECPTCIELRKELLTKEQDLQERINDLQSQLLKNSENSSKSQHLDFLKLRLEETMTEAKRHFTNYLSVRNMLNSFLESRLNQQNIQGGVKGQKLHNDILTMLKKNLEAAEIALLTEKDSIKAAYVKVSASLGKRESQLAKKDKKIKSLQDEIERRQFIEGKVQKYVKGLIGQNQRVTGFLETLKGGEVSTLAEVRRRIEDFQRVMESAQDAGQETETEEDGEEEEDDNNISVEVNDL